MIRCPYCFIVPLWKYQFRTSLARGCGVQSLVCFCSKCQPFASRAQSKAKDETKHWETRWGLFVGRMFREHTASWPMPDRIHFWKRLCNQDRSAYRIDGEEPAKWDLTLGSGVPHLDALDAKSIEGFDDNAKPSTQLFSFE